MTSSRSNVLLSTAGRQTRENTPRNTQVYHEYTRQVHQTPKEHQELIFHIELYRNTLVYCSQEWPRRCSVHQEHRLLTTGSFVSTIKARW